MIPSHRAASEERRGYLRPEAFDADSDGANQPEDVTDDKFSGLADCLATGVLRWLVELERFFGWRLLVLLFASQHVMKGAGCAASWRAAPYLYKAYGVPAQEVQILMSVTGLPWVLKPIVGLVSDLVPICGLNKAPYVLMFGVFGAAACLAVAFLPPGTLGVGQVAVCLCLLQMQISTTDLITEATYSERIQGDPKHGPNLLTYVFVGMQAFSLLGLLAFGLLLAVCGIRLVYFLLAVLCSGVLLPVALGYLQEPHRSEEETAQVRARFWRQREACALPFVMLAGTVAMSASAALSRDPAVNALVATLVALAVLLSFSLVLAPTIAKFCAFTLVQTSMSLSIGSPAFYFMTDTPEEYPEGPHFSEVFFNMVLGTAAGIFSLVGLLSYNRFSRQFTYRELLMWVNTCLSVLHLGDFIMFKRLNVQFGVPDHLLVLGASSLGTAIGQWQWMPQMALFSYLCPKGMEATMFALIVGCHNLGIGVAASLGALILKLLSVNPRGKPGDSVEFENLWVASLIASVLPLLSVGLLFKLVPDVKIGDKPLPDDQCCDATDGSLWKQLTSSWSVEGHVQDDVEMSAASGAASE